jgi:hypothetical protein
VPCATRCLEVLGRRRDPAHVVLARTRLAAGHVAARLDQRRKARLHGREHRADVVEDQRAALRLRQAAAASFRSGQLRLEGLFRQRGHVDHHERPARARAQAVDLGRDDLFPRAALAAHEHRRVGAGDVLDVLLHARHARRMGHEALRRHEARDDAAQRGDLDLELAPFRRTLHEQHELVGVDRLLQEVERAGLHRGDGLGDRADAVITRIGS